ncbi:hypothetical protein [Winogradskyella alexanderae]|uniref:Lipid/polyisoprenoid-binding YceI-like domain-containing protein n=1 Tax=Winogradskyella alexanderae TaxID=2877123 RepID=A0ABS7XUU1_9FLAO|nr:hypothetical protein [Winogradskyella alexanderae]MCA0133787.1 hypothetical protein [Winogradskyella alexanderae]
MKNTYIVLILCALLAVSCSKENAPDPFLISKHQIGLLTDSTQVKELDAIFANDSVVRYVAGDEFAGSVNSIEIFEKGGKKLLDLTPREALDSTSVVSSISILDSRFKTKKDISVTSTFKAINEAYNISKIDRLIDNSLVVSVNEINASFTIDKNDLPTALRFSTETSIDPIQIPGPTKITYFIIHW